MRVASFVVMAGLLGACASARPAAGPSSATKASDDAEIERLGQRGIELNREGQHEEAARVIERALGKSRALAPRDSELEAAILATLANTYVSLHRTQEARALIAEATPLVRAGDIVADRRLFQLQMTLGESYRYDKNPAAAVEAFQAALTIVERHEGEMASELVDALERWGTSLQQVDRNEEGDRALDRAYAIAERTPHLRGRARAIAVRVAFRQATAAGRDVELLRRNGGVARMATRGAGNAFDIPPEQATSGAPSSFTPPGDSPVAAPAPDASLKLRPVPSPGAGSVSNGAQVVAEMRADFRTCYQRALATDPQVEGSIRLLVRIAPDGQVSEAKAAALGLPVTCVDCLLERVMTSRFEPPEGGYAIIAVPVTFLRNE